MHLNLILYILSHVLGTIYRYFILSFRISTVFDINPIEFKILIFRKFVFVFVSDFIVFVFVFQM